MHPRLNGLVADLQRIFGARLRSVVAYGDIEAPDQEVNTLALVERLTFEDLATCAPLVRGWRRAGTAVPLLLSAGEFARTLDVFPVEYGAILERHVVVAGEDPFEGLRVSDADLRRACELQAKSHLIHLREGYLESGGDTAAVARLIAASAPAFEALVANLERLDPGVGARAGATPAFVAEVAAAAGSAIADPSALLARYLAVVERIWDGVDGWGSEIEL